MRITVQGLEFQMQDLGFEVSSIKLKLYYLRFRVKVLREPKF